MTGSSPGFAPGCRPASHADVDISQVRIVHEGGSRVLDIAARAQGDIGFDRPDIIVEGLEGVALPRPLVTVGGRERRDLRVRYPLADGLPDLAGREVTLTLLDSALALETRARIARGRPDRRRPGASPLRRARRNEAGARCMCRPTPLQVMWLGRVEAAGVEAGSRKYHEEI